MTARWIYGNEPTRGKERVSRREDEIRRVCARLHEKESRRAKVRAPSE